MQAQEFLCVWTLGNNLFFPPIPASAMPSPDESSSIHGHSDQVNEALWRGVNL